MTEPAEGGEQVTNNPPADVDANDSDRRETSTPGEVIARVQDPDDRRTLETAFMGMMQWGPQQNPLFQHVTEGHLDKILDNQSSETQLRYADRQNARKWRAGVFIGGALILAVVVVALVLENHDNFVQQLIPVVATGVGGFLGGFGYGEYRRSQD